MSSNFSAASNKSSGVPCGPTLIRPNIPWHHRPIFLGEVQTSRVNGRREKKSPIWLGAQSFTGSLENHSVPIAWKRVHTYPLTNLAKLSSLVSSKDGNVKFIALCVSKHPSISPTSLGCSTARANLRNPLSPTLSWTSAKACCVALQCASHLLVIVGVIKIETTEIEECLMRTSGRLGLIASAAISNLAITFAGKAQLASANRRWRATSRTNLCQRRNRSLSGRLFFDNVASLASMASNVGSGR